MLLYRQSINAALSILIVLASGSTQRNRDLAFKNGCDVRVCSQDKNFLQDTLCALVHI